MIETLGPLLAVVDMQRVFAEPDSPWHVPGFETLIQPIEGLISSFAGRSVFTRFLAPDQPHGSWQEYYGDWNFIRDPAARPLLDLAPPWTDSSFPTMDKYTFSAWGPDMKRLVGSSNELVLCGVSTECCVLATALGAADDGVAVRIVADACLSVDPRAHDCALHVVRVGFSPMIAVSTVADELQRDTSSAEARTHDAS